MADDLRVSPHPDLSGIVGERFTMPQALGIVEQWLEYPHVRVVEPGEDHWRLFREMLLKGDVRES